MLTFDCASVVCHQDFMATFHFGMVLDADGAIVVVPHARSQTVVSGHFLQQAGRNTGKITIITLLSSNRVKARSTVKVLMLYAHKN